MHNNCTIVPVHITFPMLPRSAAARGPPRLPPDRFSVSTCAQKYAGTALHLPKLKRSRLHQGADALGSVQV